MLPNYFSNKYPYTDFHELNLDWIINQFKQMSIELEKFVTLNTIKYADPIQWDITHQYETNTIVIDPLTGTAYISVQPVPSGVSLSNEDYWTVVFDLGEFVTKMAQNLANVIEPETTTTATVSSNYNDWIIWGDILYRNINPSGIIAGDQYVIDSNIERFTIEDIIGHVENLNTTDKTDLVNAINEVLQTIFITTGDLDDLNTTDKTNLVSAINEVLQTLLTTIGDLDDLKSRSKTDIVNAINSVIDADAEVWINVKDFGALGDGQTDDTIAINNALLAGAGKIVYFPDGVYMFTTQIVVQSYTHVILSANAVLKYDFANMGAWPRVVRFGDATDSPTGYNSAHDIIFEGGTIDMDFASDYQNVGHMGVCMVLWHNQNIIINDVTFTHTFNDHCIELSSSNNVIINNCKFIDCYIDSSAPDAYVYEAINTDWALHPNEYGGSFDNTALNNIYIEKCYFENVNVGIGSHGGHNTNGHRRINVNGCTFHNLQCSAIHAITWGDSLIENCRFDHINDNGSGLSVITIQECKTLNIKYNTFDANDHQNIIILHELVDSGNTYPNYEINIIENSFKYSTLSSNSAVYAYLCWRGIIYNNYFESINKPAITFYNGGYMKALNNTLHNTPTDTSATGIVLKGPATSNIITGNTMDSVAAAQYGNDDHTGASNVLTTMPNNHNIFGSIDRSKNYIDNQRDIFIGNASTGTITLTEDITHFNALYLITVGSSEVNAILAKPWGTYKKFEVGYGIGYVSKSGYNHLTITDATTLTIDSASDPIRTIIGVI